MIYYHSKELSEHLGIALSKWKRWAREFLPPDPLGGLQSGFARQFNLKDAFRVYLGGCLVADLKFTIPETRQVLADLNGWLKKSGFFRLHTGLGTGSDAQDLYYRIYIVTIAPSRFAYTIRAVRGPSSIDSLSLDDQLESYRLVSLAGALDHIALGNVETARVVGISAIHRRFLECLRTDSSRFKGKQISKGRIQNS